MKRAKNKSEKKAARRPDESFVFGPFQMARFGRTIVSRAKGSPAEYQAVQERLAGSYDKVVSDIDGVLKDQVQHLLL